MSRSPLLVVMALLVFVPATRAEDKKTGIVVDKRKRAVIIDARVAPRKITDPAYMGKIYPIELLSGSRSFAGRGRSSWPAANRSQPNARATHRMETGSLPE